MRAYSICEYIPVILVGVLTESKSAGFESGFCKLQLQLQLQHCDCPDLLPFASVPSASNFILFRSTIFVICKHETSADLTPRTADQPLHGTTVQYKTNVNIDPLFPVRLPRCSTDAGLRCDTVVIAMVPQMLPCASLLPTVGMGKST